MNEHVRRIDNIHVCLCVCVCVYVYSSPECRVKSDFVTPTRYWPENEQSKHNLINAYKENLRYVFED
jgi:hypothetical protein